MSLILYTPGETAFNTNGVGILTDAVDAEVYEVLNGQYELTVQYPVEGKWFADIVADAYITAKPDPVTAPQPFRIYRITRPMAGAVTIYARHYAYKNNKIVVSPLSANGVSAALQALTANAVTECPFEFWTDMTSTASFQVTVPTDIWTLLGSSKGSILDVYGGEYEFVGNTVKLWSRRGADRGVSIRYGKNLTDLRQDENVANMYTGVYPYWTDGNGTLVQLPEKYVSGPGEYAEEKIMPLDLSQEFDAQPTEDQLRERTQKYITDNDIGKPEVSWTVEFVQLEQTEEYRGKALLERVLLGDTVSVIFPKLGVDVSARAVAIRYNPLLGRYKSVTLGKVRANLATTIATQKQQIEQAQRPSNLQAAVDRATGWITSGRGYMIAVRDESGQWCEICSLDTPDLNQAVNVWRWNNGGLGFSSTGYNGPYHLALTQDGAIVADFITVGTLDAALLKIKNFVADLITAGKLQSQDGRTYFDLDAALFRTEKELLGDVDGIMLNGGVIMGTHRASGASGDNTMFQIYNNANGVFFIGSSDAPVHVMGDGGSVFGQTDAPTTIKGSEIRISGAPIYLSGKSLSWVDSGNGYAYLVGTDT